MVYDNQMLTPYPNPGYIPMQSPAVAQASYPCPLYQYTQAVLPGSMIEGPGKMQLSARNQFRGKVVEVKEGAVNAKVVIDIGCGNKVTSIITMDSLRDLGIRVGSIATAVIK